MAKEKEIVYCKVTKTNVNKSVRCQNLTCDTCQDNLRTQSITTDDKSKYRKRPVFKTSLCDDKRSLECLKLIESLKSYPNSDHAILNCLEKHAYRGANLYEITKALDSINQKWYEKTNTFNLLHDSEKFTKGFAKELAKEKAIKNAFRLLLSLEPAGEDFTEGIELNKEITAMKADIKKYELLLKRYFDFKFYEANFEGLVREKIGTSPINREDRQGLDLRLNILKSLSPRDKVKKIKPARQSTHDIWDTAIYIIVNEFKRIYKTDKKAYTETANLLNLCFKGVYEDTDFNLVRQRYTTFRKKANLKK